MSITPFVSVYVCISNFFLFYVSSSNSRVTHTFNCSFCGYSLKTERGMIRHVSRKHTIVSPSRNQTFYMVVEITNKGGRTKRHEIKFLDERLLFYPVQDRDSSVEAIPSDEGSEMDLDEQNRANLSPTKQSPPHDVRWSQLPPGGGFTPTYNINEASTVSQEGLFSYPSIYAEQTTLSETTNLERKGSSGPIDLYNTPYSSLDNQNYFGSVYLSQPYVEQTNSSYLLSQDSEFVQQWV